MYAVGVFEGKSRVDPKAGPRTLSGWLENQAEDTWVDLQEPAAEELTFIEDRYGVHPLTAEECGHTGVRPKIEEYDDHLYIVLHGINHNEGQDALNTVEFKFFLWKNRLITVHDKPSSSIRAAQERVKRDSHFLARNGVDSVLHVIIDAVVDHYFPVLEGLESQLLKLEGEVLRDAAPSMLEDSVRLERALLTLQRLTHAQLDVLGALSSGRYSQIDPQDLAYFHDVHDHLHRISERVHTAREVLAGIRQCYLSQVSNRTNNVMKTLAVVATMLMPATFVTSLLGMNLTHMPGRDNPETFWWITGGALAASLLSLGVMKRLRWL